MSSFTKALGAARFGDQREKRRQFVAMCHWRTMKGWETRRAKQPKCEVQKIRGKGRKKQ